MCLVSLEKEMLVFVAFNFFHGDGVMDAALWYLYARGCAAEATTTQAEWMPWSSWARATADERRASWAVARPILSGGR